MDICFWGMGAVMIACTFLWSDPLSSPGALSWSNETYFWGHLAYVIIWSMIVGYFVPLMAIYVTRLIWTMRCVGKKFHEEGILQMQPLHPDKAGGLGEFGHLAWQIDLLLLPLVAILAIWYLVTGSYDLWPFIFAMVFAIIAIPCFFFLPLWGMHTAMSQGKRQEIQSL